MPNQLAASKRRQSLAEHKAVLAALAQIAATEGTTVMALLRQAGRDVVRARLAETRHAKVLHAAVRAHAPRLPRRFATPAQLARFKREQRAFDQVLLDLRLTEPATIQERNSVVSPHSTLRILELDPSHAARPR